MTTTSMTNLHTYCVSLKWVETNLPRISFGCTSHAHKHRSWSFHHLIKSVGEYCFPSTFLRQDLNPLWPCWFECKLCMHKIRVSWVEMCVFFICKSPVNPVLLNCDYHAVVSYPFLYISALRRLPTNERLVPVDVWFPVAPDLPSCFVGKERGYSQGDDNQESTHHGHPLRKARRQEWNLEISWKIVLDHPGTKSSRTHMMSLWKLCITICCFVYSESNKYK